MYLPDLDNGSGIKRTKPFPLPACWIVLSRKFLKMPIAKLDRVVHTYGELALNSTAARRWSSLAALHVRDNAAVVNCLWRGRHR